MGGRRWTDREKNRLIWWWGYKRSEDIAEKLGRSQTSVRGKAKKLGLPLEGECTRYTSLRGVARRTGYEKRAVATVARDRLDMRVKRIKGQLLFTEGQIQQIEKEFRRLYDKPEIRPTGAYVGEWGGPGKPDACTGCGTSERAHVARGLCQRCYNAKHWTGEHLELPGVYEATEVMSSPANTSRTDDVIVLIEPRLIRR